MPGYGTLPAGQGRGLLPWAWAEERLTRSHDFWLATVTPDGAPHLMPVWAVWHEGGLWFSSSNGSRKARNLARDPRCSLSTDNPLEPVVAHGRAERPAHRVPVVRVAHVAVAVGAGLVPHVADIGSGVRVGRGDFQEADGPPRRR